MLFIDFSSAFNTIIPQQLINKLNLLGLNNSLCNWILDFLTGRPQSVHVGHNTSSTTTLSTGAPQGCVLSPLLFTLLTHDCTAKFSYNHIIKFADDTTVVGLISNNDETHYREEVAQLAEWCGANNLSLNVEKTKEVVLDFRRRNSTDHPHWPSTARLWRESAALNSWGCTSRRISPGPPTPCHSPRRHNSAYTFYAGWKEPPVTTGGYYKPPVVTHSPLCTRHFSKHCYVYTIPQKDSAIYVCLHAHSLQIILYCSPASCLTHNVSLCTCTVFIWSIRIVCIVCICIG